GLPPPEIRGSGPLACPTTSAPARPRGPGRRRTGSSRGRRRPWRARPGRSRRVACAPRSWTKRSGPRNTSTSPEGEAPAAELLQGRNPDGADVHAVQPALLFEFHDAFDQRRIEFQPDVAQG